MRIFNDSIKQLSKFYNLVFQRTYMNLNIICFNNNFNFSIETYIHSIKSTILMATILNANNNRFNSTLPKYGALKLP